MAQYVKTSAKQDVCNITVEGNIGKVQPLRFFEDGKTAVLNFSIANSQDYKKSDGSIQEVTVWYDVSVIGSRAENLWNSKDKFLDKLASVIVIGTITEVTTSEANGKTYTHLRLKASDVKRGQWKKGEQNEDQKPVDDPENPETKW